MAEFNHSLFVDSTVVYSDPSEPLTLAAMLELEPVHTRLKLACESANFGKGGDTPAARAALGKALHISPAAVSKLFSGQTTSLKAAHCFAAAALLQVDAQWLATGEGEMKSAQLPTDVLDVARLLSKIQDPLVRKAAISMARSVALDPIGKIASSVTAAADQQRWSAAVQRLADGIESMEDGELKKLAIAWATTAAFNPDRLPKEPPEEPVAPARRASDKRSTK